MKIIHIKKKLNDLQKSGQLHINFAEGFDIKIISNTDALQLYQLIMGESPVVQ